MNYLLIDSNEHIVNAWKKLFSNEPNVSIQQGDLCGVVCDAIVSPANSFGFMDGGVDLAISRRLGWDLQKRLQAQIQALPEAELLVGKALTIDTNDPKIPYLISAPTMRVPMNFGIATSLNAYLAMKALLIAAKNHPNIHSVAIPGLCTGIGGMFPMVAARQMFMAFREIEKGEPAIFTNFLQAQKYHWDINPLGMIFVPKL